MITYPGSRIPTRFDGQLFESYSAVQSAAHTSTFLWQSPRPPSGFTNSP